jgi:hypothetical protein
LVGVSLIKRLESQAGPPRARVRVQRCDHDRATGGFLIDIDGGREHVAGECGADPQACVAPIHREPPDE